MSTHICEKCQVPFECSGSAKRCPACRIVCEQCGRPADNYNRLCNRCRYHQRKNKRLQPCKQPGCPNMVRKDHKGAGFCRQHTDWTTHAIRITQYNKTVKSKPKELHHKAQNDYTVDCICKVCGKQFKGRLGTVQYNPPADGNCCSSKCVGINAAKHTPKQQTSIERAIERALQAAGISYETQVPLCGISLVDFLLPEYHIVIYCDGEFWNRPEKRKAQDQEQVAVLTAHGYKVYRFTEQEIKASPETCINQLNLGEPLCHQLGLPTS